MFNNIAMQSVFESLYNNGYQLQRCKHDSFFVTVFTGSKYEVFDNGNDCICIGSYKNSYDYQDGIENCIKNILNHIQLLK